MMKTIARKSLDTLMDEVTKKIIEATDCGGIAHDYTYDRETAEDVVRHTLQAVGVDVLDE